jgi:hypothetical protein
MFLLSFVRPRHGFRLGDDVARVRPRIQRLRDDTLAAEGGNFERSRSRELGVWGLRRRVRSAAVSRGDQGNSAGAISWGPRASTRSSKASRGISGRQWLRGTFTLRAGPGA